MPLKVNKWGPGMLRLHVVLILTSLAALGQGWQAAANATRANVHILLTDGWGNPVPEATVRLKLAGGWESPHWIRYPKERRATIQAGSYVVTVEARGFRWYEDTVAFAGGNVFLPMCLTLSDIETPEPDVRPSLKGHVAKALLIDAPFWLRIVGIHAGTIRDVEVDNAGTFLVPGILPGRYMFFVMNGGVIKGSRTVDVRQTLAEVQIDAGQAALPE